ncbi:flagellar biosynthesis protein [Roseovarius sp. LXJ103]|uniref:flagellar biosynthesis protein n=1 Tax=Roseovarius carneus TaxID=2853164 RepID=UPI000D60CA9D|nr:flagellar biosynthesis protein [Roseovarius carneus]MBZ8117553.1 flagellar biosynthesis protein [Roseovarius carneus]PWE36654.1 flagellar biosynthesis protein [Pelagicola sp. LXJ1103]
MGIAHLLEDFGSTQDEHTIHLSDVSLEEQRLEAFEKGYSAGWDDAVKAAKDDASRISADFSSNLMDLSFTVQEAQAGLVASLKPLLKGMVDQVLPRLARESLGNRVIETIQSMAGEACQGKIRIITAPANLAALEALTEGLIGMDVTLLSEISLGEGQVHIEVAGDGREINLDRVLDDISKAVDGFFEDQNNDMQKETA